MKGKRTIATILALALMLALLTGLSLAQGPAPQALLGTTFTYQGKLNDGGSLANGDYDFEFNLYDVASGGTALATVLKDDVTIVEGLFTVQLDFGDDAFNGDARWLEIGVRPGSSSGAYTSLSPRQELTPAPYALALPGLWTEQNATSPNVIGGYSLNYAMAGVVGATIGGGGFTGAENFVTDDYGTVGGGTNNQAGEYAVVGGGSLNEASGYAAVVAGGGGHSGSTPVPNTASASWSVVSGGVYNTASGAGAMVPGGNQCLAQGENSFAAGTQAKALHDGAFVWADDNYFDMASYGDNQFIARATGGVHFVLGIDGSGTPTWSCSAINGTSWQCSSDRNLKDNLVLVDGQDVLERLSQVPVYTWSAKGQDPTIRHIGPMAQDFYAAFQVGENDQQLATIDLDGVSLAAIQELYHLLQDKDAQITDLEARVAALEASNGSRPAQSSFPGSWLLVGGVVMVAAVAVQRRYVGCGR